MTELMLVLLVPLTFFAWLVLQALVYVAAQRPHLYFAKTLLEQFPEPFKARLEQRLQRRYPLLSAAQWLAQRLLGCIWLLLIPWLPLPSWQLALLVLPPLILLLQQKLRVQQYRQRLLYHWPAALDVMAMVLHSGASFRAALHALAKHSHLNYAFAELARLNRALQAGTTMPQSLDSLRKHGHHSCFDSFCTAIEQAQTTGSGLTEVLRLQAAQLREAQVLNAEKSAQEAVVKLLLPLMSCFFPVTFLLILGPIFIRFTQGGVL